jgi:methanogenic corrinoid protein MtbC1
MGKEELREELLKQLHEGVVEFEEDKVREAAQRVIDEGLNVYDAVMNGLAAGMQEVGELYDQHEYFVPELLMAADALYVGLDILRPHIKIEDLGDKPRAR